MILQIFILTSLLLLECDGARILAFLPSPLHSHQNTFRPIFKGLAKNGHDVTVVTSLPVKNTLYKQIDISSTDFEDTLQNIDLYAMRTMSWFGDMIVVADFFENTMHVALKNPEVHKLIHSTDVQFDLVITESTFGQEAYAVLGHRFKAIVIEIQALVPTFWLYHLIGNPYYFSHSVTFYTHSSDKMNFMERLKNTIMGVTTLLARRYYNMPRQEALVEQYFKYPGWETRPPLIDLLSNISLVLQNTHIATHYPHPYNPNVIEIAGVQLQEPTKLPQDLQTYLDNAIDGFIYFSFGSAVQGSMMPENTKQAFLSAFRKIPNKVLWKWETETLPNKPSNVKISKWFPQAAVLAHPNLKIFVTHGGLASMTESVYHGVPLVVIPMFVDQLKNIKQIEAAGSGIILDFDNVTEASVSWSLHKVFTDSSYREAAHRQSRILRDNPLPPLDRAVYWIEYVLRHKGAPHLRTAAASLPWYKYFLIDVIATLLVSVILVLLIFYFLLRSVYRLLFGRSKKIVHNKVSKKKYN